MQLATWNCNSIRARLDYSLEWLERAGPDIVCLQETKLEDEQFPHEAFAGVGYRAHVHGQKTYNGVAILYRDTLVSDEPIVGLGDPGVDHQARAIAASFDLGGVPLHVVNVYVPNGKSVEHPDFELKLRFLDRLLEVIGERYTPGAALALVGDFNVAPDDRDVHDPSSWEGHLLCHPDERSRLGRLVDWGLRDLYREHHAEGEKYSWWDYRGGDFRFNRGLRIDLILTTETLTARCNAIEILREERKVKGKERWKPSDHAPVVASFE